MAVYGNIVLNEYSLLENINISAELICKISEQCLSGEILSEAKVDNITKQHIDSLNKFLKKTGNEDKSKDIQNKLKKTSNESVDIIRSEGINKSSIQKISAKFQDFVNEIVDSLEFNNVDFLEFDKYDANKIRNSFVLVMIACTINTLVLTILSILFGPKIGNIGMSTLCAPIVEELCKQISIKGQFTKEFAIVFNLYEATYYIATMTANGLDFTHALKVRLAVVGMHCVTHVVQWFTGNKKIQEKMGIKPEDRDKCSTIGYTLGVLIHATWNGLAAFSESFNNLFMNL